MTGLGHPRLHFRQTDSTNLRARELALAGAPHGTLVTADEQVAGRGRQGRAWASPPGTALLMSVLLHDPPPLLSLLAGIAVAETVDELLADESPPLAADAHHPRAAPGPALVKWPNDVLVDGRKVAGILVESRPQANWAVLGVGLNVAVPPAAFPPDLRERAGTLGRAADAIEPALATLLAALCSLADAPDRDQRVLSEMRARGALTGRMVAWADGRASGMAIGIDAEGRLLVADAETGAELALDAGEVHLVPARAADAGRGTGHAG